MSRIRVWRCRYVACNRILNDVDYNQTCKFCKFHKAVRITEKNHTSYQKRIGCVRPSRMDQILFVLKTNGKASTYELLAFTGIKKREVLRVLIWNLRKKGHSITNNKSTKHLYQYNGTTKKHKKDELPGSIHND